DGWGVLVERGGGERPDGRRAGADPESGDRVRVPDVQPAAAGDGAAQCGAAADLCGGGCEGAAAASGGDAGAGGAGRAHAAPALGAVGRAAPAGGDCACAGERAGAAVGGRADGQPGQPDGRGDHGAVRRAAAPRPDDRAGHARARHRRARPPRDHLARRLDRQRREARAGPRLSDSAMQLREGIRLAFAQIRAQKLKSFFAVVGVIIGVMFLITVVSVIEGMNRYMEEDFARRIHGFNTLTLRRTPSVQVNPSEEVRRQWRRRPRLTLEDADAIRSRLTTPALGAVQSDAGGRVKADDTGIEVENVWITAASAEYFRIRE